MSSSHEHDLHRPMTDDEIVNVDLCESKSDARWIARIEQDRGTIARLTRDLAEARAEVERVTREREAVIALGDERRERDDTERARLSAALERAGGIEATAVAWHSLYMARAYGSTVDHEAFEKARLAFVHALTVAPAYDAARAPDADKGGASCPLPGKAGSAVPVSEDAGRREVPASGAAILAQADAAGLGDIDAEEMLRRIGREPSTDSGGSGAACAGPETDRGGAVASTAPDVREREQPPDAAGTSPSVPATPASDSADGVADAGKNRDRDAGGSLITATVAPCTCGAGPASLTHLDWCGRNGGPPPPGSVRTIVDGEPRWAAPELPADHWLTRTVRTEVRAEVAAALERVAVHLLTPTLDRPHVAWMWRAMAEALRAGGKPDV